jgi:thiol-disulfide isomerase/thioredoxin
MVMRNLLTFAFILSLVSLTAAQENIIGQTSKDEILKSEHQSWFNDTYSAYKPEAEITNELTHIFKKNDFKVDVYFGTWCSDSQREVPKLIKLLELSQFNFKNLELIGVDEDKVIPGISKEKRKELNVFNVPTIIVYQNDKEINRFVEYAQESLEKDMLKIFSKKSYKNSYSN